MKKQVIAASVLAILTSSAVEAQAPLGPPPRGFKRVSNLVKLPSFLPGLGVLYVRPETLPAGPFLAYDRQGRRVSTVYMIPVEDIGNRKKFDLAGLRVGTITCPCTSTRAILVWRCPTTML